MAIKQVKCPMCNKLNDKEDTVKLNNRYYCPDCAEERKKEIQINSDGWDGLYEYLKELYGKVDGKMISLIAKYRKEPYNYTNEGMRLTLYYYHVLLDNPITDETTGLIPYYYEKAKQEYIINRDISNFNSEHPFQEKIVKIKVTPMKRQHNKYRKTIDLAELERSIDNEK